MSLEIDIGRELERLAVDLGNIQAEDVAPILAVGDSAFDMLASELNNPDPAIRALAAALLGELGNLKAIPHLIRVFSFANPDPVPAYVRYALSRLIAPTELDPLVTALHGTDPAIRIEIIRVLGSIGGQTAIETLMAALHDKHPVARQTAAEMLGMLQAAEAVQALVMKLLDYDEPVRMACAMALRAIGEPADPLLFRALQADDPAIQAYLARALARQGNFAAVEALHKMYRRYIGSRMPEVAHEAALALAEIGHPSAVEPLLQVLVKVADQQVDHGDPDFDPLERIYAVAVTLDGALVEPLTELLDHESLTVQETAIRLLGDLRDARAVSWLLEKLESDDGSVRDTAIIALGQIGDSRAAHALAKFLNDASYERRELAAEALAQLRSV